MSTVIDWRDQVPITGMVIWAFEEAPEELRAMSEHGGDENYIAVRRKGNTLECPIFDWGGQFQGGWFGSCSITAHDTAEFEIRIGAHA